MALGTYAGFQGVPETLRMAGRNYGLRGLRFVLLILVPSALPAILSGLRIGWAFAWRTLIAAELFFGASSGQGGLGWYIFQNRNELYTDKDAMQAHFDSEHFAHWKAASADLIEEKIAGRYEVQPATGA